MELLHIPAKNLNLFKLIMRSSLAFIYIKLAASSECRNYYIYWELVSGFGVRLQCSLVSLKRGYERVAVKAVDYPDIWKCET